MRGGADIICYSGLQNFYERNSKGCRELVSYRYMRGGLFCIQIPVNLHCIFSPIENCVLVIIMVIIIILMILLS